MPSITPSAPPPELPDRNEVERRRDSPRSEIEPVRRYPGRWGGRELVHTRCAGAVAEVMDDLERASTAYECALRHNPYKTATLAAAAEVYRR